MDKPENVCLTARDVAEFCRKIQSCDDGISNLKEGQKRIEEFIKIYDEQFDNMKIWRGWLTGILATVSFVVGIMGNTMWNYYVDYPETIRAEVKRAVQSEFETLKAELADKYNFDIQ